MAVKEPANQGIISRLSSWWYGGNEEPPAKVVKVKKAKKEGEQGKLGFYLQQAQFCLTE